MTQTKRIVLNVVASYGRSIYSIVIGLLCGRWTLMALGHVDYGLMGVVGGLAGMVAFINGLMATAVGRFYAFNIGSANIDGSSESLENSRRWFNTAVLMHTVLPIVLLIVGYPLGKWAISCYLTIPFDRVADCIWVWRFVCCSCFVSMINVPFRAMYTAKQEIAELTIYSFVTVTLNVFVLYYMVNHPSVWLVRFMLWTCVLSVVPQVVITMRAVIKYPECRLIPKYLWDAQRTRALLAFAGGRFIYATASMLSVQGATVLVNKMLGPVKNATMSVGSAVSGHCLTLSSAISGAFSPVVTQAAGAKEYARMRRMMIVTCTMSALSVIVFTLPLLLESKTVLILWLGKPPEWAWAVCAIILIQYVFARITDGLWIGIFAMGRIAKYQICEAAMQFTVLPLAYVAVRMGFDVIGVASAQVVASILNIFVKLYFARKLCGLPVRSWINQTCIPLAALSAIAIVPGIFVCAFMRPSLLRVVVTTLFIQISLLPGAWFFVIPLEAKAKIAARFRWH